jgi:hypothetical protein
MFNLLISTATVLHLKISGDNGFKERLEEDWGSVFG